LAFRVFRTHGSANSNIYESSQDRSVCSVASLTRRNLALIHWHSIPSRVVGQTVSRGEFVRLALLAGAPALVDATIEKTLLARVNAFCLINIFLISGRFEKDESV